MQGIEAPFNMAIIAATAIISYFGFTKAGFAERYIFDVQHILRDKQYYRIISSGALHGSWVHLIFNMYTLYSFGSSIEWLFGFWQLGIIYVSGIVGGGLISLALHRNHIYRALGASGGVCGVIFACIFLEPGMSVQLFFIPFDIPAPVFAIMFVVISVLASYGRMDNIGHDAHLGGAITGLLVTTLLHPYIISQNPFLYLGVMGLTVTSLSVLYFYPISMPEHKYVPIRWTKNKSKKKDDDTPQQNEPTDEEVLNRLLDKVSKHGIHSLTYVEKQRLERISKRRKAAEDNS